MDLPVEAQEAANNVIKMRRDADWQNDFKKNSDDGIKTKSLYNIRLIMEHDEMLKGLVVFDEFSEQIVKKPQTDKSLLNLRQDGSFFEKSVVKLCKGKKEARQ